MRKQNEEHSHQRRTWRQLIVQLRELSLPWRIVLGSALLLLLLVVFYPFKTTIVPDWNVHVVDEGGAAVREIRVTEHWQHYLLESEGQEDARITDAKGRIDFPARSVRAGLLRRLLSRIGKLVKAGNEARTDAYASIVVWGSRNHQTTVSVYQGEGLPQQEIVVRRVR